ncbi:hypothetical protein JY409_15610 [Stenotrophomonas maltophilia]|jgi:hypothetical protein|uniref:hypothetical protein n=1 Tax=Stenotrophomonas maltophilia TaxID=40324 RepID=UPI0015DF84E8|nr:hypothetical protein [Stenotrophomonas maltophilia]MBN4939469.1 hypothetical protein [Stenotrophomonas maltophilia]
MGGLAATVVPAIRSQPAKHAEIIRIFPSSGFGKIITLMRMSPLGYEASTKLHVFLLFLDWMTLLNPSRPVWPRVTA